MYGFLKCFLPLIYGLSFFIGLVSFDHPSFLRPPISRPFFDNASPLFLVHAPDSENSGYFVLKDYSPKALTKLISAIFCNNLAYIPMFAAQIPLREIHKMCDQTIVIPMCFMHLPSFKYEIAPKKVYVVYIYSM